MKFKTHSGSTYEIVDHPAGRMVARLNEDYSKRADGEFVQLHNDPVVEVGQPVFMVLSSLANRGEDDHGTDPAAASTYTYRTTSPVTEVEL